MKLLNIQLLVFREYNVKYYSRSNIIKKIKIEESNVDILDNVLLLKFVKQRILQNLLFLSLLYKDFTEVLFFKIVEFINLYVF